MPARKRRHQERHIRIRSVRKDPPDIRKVASALVALAIAQSEADAERQHQAEQPGQAATPRDEDHRQNGAA